MIEWVSSPVVAMGLYFLLALGLYGLGGRWRAKGEETEGKRLPYACGEDLFCDETRLSYQRFYRLALAFVVVHIGTLVVATLPRALGARLLATVYLLGVFVCVDSLARGGD